jgi:uncharacterized protein (TIGR03435 family)
MIRLGLLVMFSAVSVRLGQTQSPNLRPAFEVASIKPNVSGGERALVQAVPGRLLMQNFAVQALILLAYGVPAYRVTGEPSWAGSEHYDIQAKADGNVPVREMEGPMLQALLADRFQLAVHRETRQLAVYELRVAKSGAKLQRSEPGHCVPYSVDSPPPPPAPGASAMMFCGYTRGRRDGLKRITDGVEVSMKTLAANLSQSELQRTVIDKTSLDRKYDVHLEWTPEGLTGDAVSADAAAPSIFTALKEQLGLQLDAAKRPVEVLVIDHVERPSGN